MPTQAKRIKYQEKVITTGTLLALIHWDVSETLDVDCKGDAKNFSEELLDVYITWKLKLPKDKKR